MGRRKQKREHHISKNTRKTRLNQDRAQWHVDRQSKAILFLSFYGNETAKPFSRIYKILISFPFLLSLEI